MKPSKHKMTVLSQIFKLIPRNLIPKLGSNPFESVFAIYKPDFEVVRFFMNLSENFSR